MDNPIGRFRREKLEEINLKVDSFIDKFDLIKEIIPHLDSIQNEVSSFKEDFKEIKEVLFYEPSPEEIKEQEKAAQEQIDNMKMIVRGAISDMLEDPKNQENIKQWVDQFMGGVSGAQQGQDIFGMGWDQLTNKDGELDWMKAAFALFNQKKGSSSSPITSSGTKGAY